MFIQCLTLIYKYNYQETGVFAKTVLKTNRVNFTLFFFKSVQICSRWYRSRANLTLRASLQASPVALLQRKRPPPIYFATAFSRRNIPEIGFLFRVSKIVLQVNIFLPFRSNGAAFFIISMQKKISQKIYFHVLPPMSENKWKTWT